MAAIRILHWPITEGAGTVVSETENDRDLFFRSSGGSPTWETGPDGVAGTALGFSGLASGLVYAGMDTPIYCYPPYAVPRGLSVVTKFKLLGGYSGGIVGGHFLDPHEYPADDAAFDIALANAAQFALFIDTDLKLRVGAHGASGVSTRHQSVQIPVTVNDGNWHEAVAVFRAINNISVRLDGTWYSPPVVTRLCSTTNVGSLWPLSSAFLLFWSIGSVLTYQSDAARYCKYSNRSLYGLVAETSVYCGSVTDEDLEPPPAVVNSIMFSCNT